MNRTLALGVIFLASLVFITLLLFGPTAVQAGAWLQEKGGFYSSLRTSYFSTTEEFNHRGEKVDIFAEHQAFQNASFSGFSVKAYLEYGLFEKLTMIADMPFRVLNSNWDKFIIEGVSAGSESNYAIGLADLTLSGRYPLTRKGLVSALQGGIRIPLGSDNSPGSDGAMLRSGAVDYEGFLQVGFSLYPVPAYVTSSIGYRFRNGPLHDEIDYAVEIGFSLGRAAAKLYLNGIQNTTEPPNLLGGILLAEGGNTVIIGDQHVTKISPSITFNVTNTFGVEAEITRTLWGTNTTSATTFSLAFIIQG